MKKKNLLLALLALSLVACGGGTEDSSLSVNSSEESIVSSEGDVSESETSVSNGETEPMAPTTQVMIHYARNDGNYNGWGVWAWQKEGLNQTEGEIHYFKDSDEIYGNYTILDLINDERYFGATKIGIIAKTHSEAVTSDTWDGNGKQDIASDRFIDIPAEAPGGILHIYLYEGVSDVMFSLEEALKDKIVSSRFTSETKLETSVILSSKVPEITQNMFHFYVDGVEVNGYTFTYSDKKISLKLEDEVDVRKNYSVKIDFPDGVLSMDCDISHFYDHEQFKDNYTYFGNDLGVTFNSAKNRTTFKLWAPISSAVKLNIYDVGTPAKYASDIEKLGLEEETQDIPSKIFEMKKGQQGVWELSIPGYLHGKYYTYSVTNGNVTSEVVDPYAKSCGIDGLRGLVVDFDVIDAEVDWDSVPRADNISKATDASIYELHVRDATISNTSGVSELNRGRFLGLSEKGTTYTENGVEVSTGIDNIKELGVTHVQLQPFYDFATVEESKQLLKDRLGEDDGGIHYNWGYDPLNYNCLEGSYSTNPFDGLTRVREFKQMMKTFNELGIQVNMDVVYNHTAGSGETNFEKILPGYYHRMLQDGSFSNGSGCGNEMATDRMMYRKFVVDSCKFWLDEYKLSGYRFDLMALIDTVTISQVYTECKEIYEDVLVYGEPWAGGTSTSNYIQTTATTIQGLPGVGAFNDQLRDAVKGGNDLSKGWVHGATDDEKVNKIIPGIYGQFNSNLNNPLKTVNYVSCHDNYALYDQIALPDPNASEQTIKNRVIQAQAMVFLSEGVPFMHGGEEFLRTKNIANKDLTGLSEEEVRELQLNNNKTIHNSYNAGDVINEFDYSYKVKNIDVYNSMKDFISVRNDFEGFRLGTYDEIISALKVNKQGATIDYEISYNGETYRVVTNATSSQNVTGLSGYSLVYSNFQNKSLSGSTYSVATNEIVVFKK